METGIELIAQERQEQIEKHGYTVASDVKRYARKIYDIQLAMAANALICDDGDGYFGAFPVDWDDAIATKMLDKPYKERLIIAGALIAAELDRLQALENQA